VRPTLQAEPRLAPATPSDFLGCVATLGGRAFGWWWWWVSLFEGWHFRPSWGVVLPQPYRSPWHLRWPEAVYPARHDVFPAFITIFQGRDIGNFRARRVSQERFPVDRGVAGVADLG
jgi:hypothetical protein